jgi:hypothetical protein
MSINSSDSSEISPLAVFARFEDRNHCVSDVGLSARQLYILSHRSGGSIEQLVKAADEVLRNQFSKVDMPVAYVGIGWGRRTLAVGKSDLRRGDFIESEPEDSRIDALIQRIQDIYRELLVSIRFGAEKGAVLRVRENIFQLVPLVPSELKRGGTKLKAMMDIRSVRDEGEKITRLFGAFEFACKLAKLADDLVTDDNDVRRNRNKPYSVADKFRDLGRLKDLEIFLNHPDPVLQAYAGICLGKIYPDRVEAILTEIEKSEEGRVETLAGIVASAGLIPLRFYREQAEKAGAAK